MSDQTSDRHPDEPEQGGLGYRNVDEEGSYDEAADEGRVAADGEEEGTRSAED